jgi:CRP-like cAMP-binding protein
MPERHEVSNESALSSEYEIGKISLRVEVKLFVGLSHFAHRKRILDKAATALRDTGESERISQFLAKSSIQQDIALIEEGDLGRKFFRYCTSQARCHGLITATGRSFKLGYV